MISGFTFTSRGSASSPRGYYHCPSRWGWVRLWTPLSLHTFTFLYPSGDSLCRARPLHIHPVRFTCFSPRITRSAIIWHHSLPWGSHLRPYRLVSVQPPFPPI